MATVSPVINTDVRNLPRVVWEELATGDTINAFTNTEQWALAGAMQFSGTFGSATLTMQVSNDGATWFTAKDLQGNDITTTNAAAFFEFTTAAAYIRIAISGGTGDDVDAVMTLRGLY